MHEGKKKKQQKILLPIVSNVEEKTKTRLGGSTADDPRKESQRWEGREVLMYIVILLYQYWIF